MKRKLSILFVVIAIVFIFVIPAQAIYCSKCGAQNPDDGVFCIQCGAKLIHLEEGSIYDQASELVWQDKHDDAISLLENHLGNNPNDMKAKISLAEAYLAKCEMLKEKGNKQYKDLVFKPLTIGRDIIAYRDQHLPEGLYICARSFTVNNRPRRGLRFIKKAIKFSKSPRVEYYFMLGDSSVGVAKIKDDNYFEIKKAKKAYEDIINMNASNDVKGLAYYKLAVLESRFGSKKDVQKALESGLELAQSEALIQRIRDMWESM